VVRDGWLSSESLDAPERPDRGGRRGLPGPDDSRAITLGPSRGPDDAAELAAGPSRGTQGSSGAMAVCPRRASVPRVPVAPAAQVAAPCKWQDAPPPHGARARPARAGGRSWRVLAAGRGPRLTRPRGAGCGVPPEPLRVSKVKDYSQNVY
jgi:hypothetical protein